MAEENDSDWEYEYHETETESFYVTLDLSSAASSYRPTKRNDLDEPNRAADASASRANNSSSPVADAPNATTQQDEANSAIQLDEEVLDAPDVTIPQDGDNADEAEPASDPSDRIQILDLHSPNPIISYQNQIYSCEWTSTIGTDVLLTTPDPDFPHPILKQERGVSVLATTRIKLFGRPVQIATRDGKETIQAPVTSTTAADTTFAPAPATPVKIPVNSASRQARHNQARFLERLIAIKAAKGEKDEVTVYAQKAIQGPEKQNPTQEQPASGDANADADMDDGSAPIMPLPRGASGRSRGRVRRRRGLNPRPKGGLFKDPRQQIVPAQGTDTDIQPAATPSTWYQLASPRTDDGNFILQPTAATSLSTPPSPPPSGYHPQTSRRRIDLPNTDRTSIDIAPNVPPDPDAASKSPDVYPMKPSAPLTAESEFERTVSGTEHGAGGPSLPDEVERSSVPAAAAAVVDGDGDGDDDGDGPVGVGERGSESDVEMGDT